MWVCDLRDDDLGADALQLAHPRVHDVAVLQHHPAARYDRLVYQVCRYRALKKLEDLYYSLFFYESELSLRKIYYKGELNKVLNIELQVKIGIELVVLIATKNF